MSQNIKEVLDCYLAARKNLLDLVEALPAYVSEKNCPLRSDHWALSNQLFGVGSYGWACKFCGETHDT